MKLARLALATLLLAFIAGCGEPVPADKKEYVGEWHGKDMLLLITQDGSVRYSRRKSGSTTTINGPIQRYDGPSFWVGIGILSTKFDVSKPPYRDGNLWKMVVDGVELTRSLGSGPEWKA
jgi:hypothetical protein